MRSIIVRDIEPGFGISFELTIGSRTARFSTQGMDIVSEGKFNVFAFISALPDYEHEFIMRLNGFGPGSMLSPIGLREAAEIARQISCELEKR